MKILRKVLAVVLSVAMVFLGTIGTCAKEISDAVHAKRNAEATIGYTKLMDYFGTRGITIDPVYPDEYGGAYIDSNDNLVVQVVEKANTDDGDFSFERLSEITGLQTFKIQEVKYSFNELIKARNDVGSFIPKIDLETGKLKDLPQEKASLYQSEIVETSIDQKNNSVVVLMDDISRESTDEFREIVSNAPFLKFEVASEERPALQSSYSSGSGWLNPDTTKGSIGFPATYGTHSGFVTAYHCTVGGMNTIDGWDYGTRIHGSSTLDYAFIENQGSVHTITRSLYDTTKSLSSGMYAYLAEGSDVGRTGRASGYSSGSVIRIGSNNFLNQDLILTDCGSANGDSGGPYFGSPSYPASSIAGIHIAGASSSNTTYCLSIGYLYDAGYRIT